jgi:hypothetical protein
MSVEEVPNATFSPPLKLGARPSSPKEDYLSLRLWLRQIASCAPSSPKEDHLDLRKLTQAASNELSAAGITRNGGASSC